MSFLNQRDWEKVRRVLRFLVQGERFRYSLCHYAWMNYAFLIISFDNAYMGICHYAFIRYIRNYAWALSMIRSDLTWCKWERSIMREIDLVHFDQWFQSWCASRLDHKPPHPISKLKLYQSLCVPYSHQTREEVHITGHPTSMAERISPRSTKHTRKRVNPANGFYVLWVNVVQLVTRLKRMTSVNSDYVCCNCCCERLMWTASMWTASMWCEWLRAVSDMASCS